MLKKTNVTIANGPMRKEFDCEFFVGLALMDNPEGEGYGCEQLIAGVTDLDGVFTAIRMLKHLEDRLYELLPVSRELAEALISVEASLQEAIERRQRNNPSGWRLQDDPFLLAVSKFFENPNDTDNPLKRLFEGFGNGRENK